MTTKDHNKKPGTMLRVVTDDLGSSAQDQQLATGPSALTPKLLDNYVTKLVQFEKDALVGQELGIQPTALTDITTWSKTGLRSAIRIKKQGETATIGIQPTPPVIPGRKGT